MITDEDILTAYFNQCVDNHDFFENPRIAFTAGARWMQNELAEFAIKWLKDNWREYINTDRDGMICFSCWQSDMRKALTNREEGGK